MVARFNRPELKTRLMDAAWELFATRGYDGATIEALIEKVGVSKGAFYHYFENKLAVLDAVMDRMIRTGSDQLRLIATDEGLSALDKLNRYMASSRNWRVSNLGTLLDAARVILRDENAIIRNRLQQRTISAHLPILSDILAQGIKEGVFDLPDAIESARFLLHLFDAIGEIQTRSLLGLRPGQADLSAMSARAELYLNFVEKMLGAPPRSIERVDPEVFEKARAWTQSNGAELKEDGHEKHER